MSMKLAFERFDNGLIKESLLGEDDFFIPNYTYRDKHDDLLVMSWLTDWACDEIKKETAKKAIWNIHDEYNCQEKHEEYLDFSLACLISISCGNLPFINKSKYIDAVKKYIDSHQKDIMSNDKLVKLIQVLNKYC